MIGRKTKCFCSRVVFSYNWSGKIKNDSLMNKKVISLLRSTFKINETFNTSNLLFQEQKTPTKLWKRKHTPLNYTGSYKQNKVSFVFTSAGVMTGNSAILYDTGNIFLHRSSAPAGLLFQMIFPAIFSPSSNKEIVCGWGREKSPWAPEKPPADWRQRLTARSLSLCCAGTCSSTPGGLDKPNLVLGPDCHH